MSSDKSNKDKPAGGVPSEAPPVAASTAASGYTVSGALRKKVNRLYAKQSDRDRTLKALEAGKVVHVGAHKLQATRVENNGGGQ